jgi:hypothetical protein
MGFVFEDVDPQGTLETDQGELVLPAASHAKPNPFLDLSGLGGEN